MQTLRELNKASWNSYEHQIPNNSQDDVDRVIMGGFLALIELHSRWSVTSAHLYVDHVSSTPSATATSHFFPSSASSSSGHDLSRSGGKFGHFSREVIDVSPVLLSFFISIIQLM